MDCLTPEQRKRNMSAIKGRDTKPEVLVRKLLHRLGYRFRIQRKDLPGKPDIVLPKHKTAIFINGCFWHRHEGCKYASTPSTNSDFWKKKFAANVERDARNYAALKDQGWNVLIIWECEVKELLRTKIIPGLPSHISTPYPTDEDLSESADLMAAEEESE
ncbi:MAG: DNA mismatch endonuclease Vsr [Bacteroidaceae bacterium]|nr:DNA mismatch endonuclease Vsr [Bacteroidaceae bacterium]